MQAMEETVAAMKYDTQKAPLGVCVCVWGGVQPRATCLGLHNAGTAPPLLPLGKLTAEQVKSGYAALRRIEDCINQEDYGASLVRACNDFYTRIPHNFG